MKIVDIRAREIFDSRGIPTLACEIDLDDGVMVDASVPAGISRGMHEAVELRDGGDRLMGLGVQEAVAVIEQVIAPIVIDREPDVVAIDLDLIGCDGTDDKSVLGANAMLATSIAVCRAQAHQELLTVYELIALLCNFEKVSLPCPMFNVLGGGLHANNNFPIQEMLIVPAGAQSFHDAMEIGVSIYYSLQAILKAKGKIIAVGYEGEFVPHFNSVTEAFDVLMEAIEKSGAGKKVMISLDMAASYFYNIETGLYTWAGKEVPADDLIEWYKELIDTYPLYSIEDGLSEVDWNNWKRMKQEIGSRVTLVGDDLFATNPQRIWAGIESDVATTSLIKPNQIGTLTETLQAVTVCQENGWNVIVSHRSGETNDSFISDLAVGVSASHIKAGGCSRGERMAKYNRLLEIETELLSE
jgi:enolase